MKQHTLDLIFSDNLSKVKDADKSFCPLEKAKVKALKEIHSTLSLRFERTIPKCSYTTPKTYFVETSTHLKVGISFELYHEQDDENEIKNIVKRFIDLIANEKIYLEQDQNFADDEVIVYLYKKSGKSIKKPVDVYIDSEHIGSIEGMYSEVIFPHKPEEEYSINARIADLDHDKRRILAIGPDIKYQIAFDVEKNFKSLCEQYAEQSLVTLHLIQEYDSYGQPKVTLKSFEKVKT